MLIIGLTLLGHLVPDIALIPLQTFTDRSWWMDSWHPDTPPKPQPKPVLTAPQLHHDLIPASSIGDEFKISLNEEHWNVIFRGQVATEEALPKTGNRSQDFYQTRDKGAYWMWVLEPGKENYAWVDP